MTEHIQHEDQTFSNIDYSEKKLINSEFINCVFSSCNFSKSDLSNNDFLDCKFKSCNFSLTILQHTGLKNIKFTGSRLLGIDFSVCNSFLFTVSFQDCQLDYSSFFQRKMKSTQFVDCSLKQVDFGEVDLSGSVFHNCDLEDAVFNRSNLEKTDFRTVRNFQIDPEQNKMKQAIFSVVNLAGLLGKYNLRVE